MSTEAWIALVLIVLILLAAAVVGLSLWYWWFMTSNASDSNVEANHTPKSKQLNRDKSPNPLKTPNMTIAGVDNQGGGPYQYCPVVIEMGLIADYNKHAKTKLKTYKLTKTRTLTTKDIDNEDT